MNDSLEVQKRRVSIIEARQLEHGVPVTLSTTGSPDVIREFTEQWKVCLANHDRPVEPELLTRNDAGPLPRDISRWKRFAADS